MPTYVYEVVPEDGSTPERFEVVQSIRDEPLTQHPETGQPVRRVIMPFQIARQTFDAAKAVQDDRKLEQMGFTKYVKSDDGKYDKVVGKGPDQLQK